MKRGLMGTLALVAVLAILGTACNNGNQTPSTGGGSASAGAAKVQTLKPGVLQVGSCLDYPPFETVKHGNTTGFDVDLTEAIAQKLGLKVEWIRANFNTIFTAVAADKFDMVAAAVTSTGKTGAERDQVVDFSSYYFNSLQSLAVNTDQTPDIRTTDQLTSDDSVGVQKGTTGAIWAKENLEPKGVAIKTYSAAPDAFRDLEAGNVTGVINDQPSSVEIVKQFPGTAVVQSIDTNEKYSFAFSPSNPSLREAVDGALKQLIDDGTYATIFHKYFGVKAEVPPEFQPTS